LEEAYGLYLNHYPELAEDKRDELLRRFSSYLRKAKENKS